jgi:probable FeS assembly SUF system protein SufT
MVWAQLKTVYDPEIPVNIVDLGLIYSCDITVQEQGGKKIDVKMSMTAPGCGMGNVLKADVEGKLARLPEVKEVHVEVVFDPPWSPARMSEAAKLQLGFDLDYGKSSVTGISR